jgi:nitrate/nitrite transporter NarK
MTPEEQAYLLSIMGNDADAGIFNDPEYQFRNMRTPNSVVDPKTGQYLGEYEMMPQSLLGTEPQLRNMDASMSNLDAARLAAMRGQATGMAGMAGGNNLGGVATNQDMRMIEQNMGNSGNQIIDQSRLNLGALLKRLGMQ